MSWLKIDLASDMNYCRFISKNSNQIAGTWTVLVIGIVLSRRLLALEKVSTGDVVFFFSFFLSSLRWLTMNSETFNEMFI